MMKNNTLLILLLVSINMFSQQIYFNTGKNHTKYTFKDANNQTFSGFQNGTGTFYEIGIVKPLKIKNVFYEVGLSFNEYNAMGDRNAYRWETQYLGIHGGLSYSLLANKDKVNKFNLFVSTALNVSTLVYGRQQLNAVYYDLSSQKEFSGIFLEPSVGLNAKYAFSSFGAISIGYNYCYSANISNSSNEKLSFNTNQFKLGFYFKID